ncbi:MAG: response regulator transcription factor [Proteobacteria bacterium]|nr:response regulator transcription factor [Pseudomonadota bacterium]
MLKGANILVVEDNKTTAKTIALFLEGEGAKVTLAFTGPEGLSKAMAKDFDATILDWMLPGMDGLTLCKKLRKQSQLPIIMLTAKTTEDDIVEGLEAGADDYVKKPFQAKELVARVKSALRRRHSFQAGQDGLITFGDLKINEQTRKVLLGPEEIHLTKNEFNLLKTLASSPGRIFTRDQLITAALRPDFDGFDRTVDAHISNLRKKLGKSNHKYIQTEVGIGYRFQV